MKISKIILFFIAIEMIISACSYMEKTTYQSDSLGEQITVDIGSSDNQYDSNLIKAEVAEIVDGDTLKVFITHVPKDLVLPNGIGINSKPVTLRLIAIDTPESTKRVQLWGPESSQYLKKLIEGGNVQIALDDKAVFE